MSNVIEHALTQLPKFSRLVPAILFKRNSGFLHDTELPNTLFCVDGIKMDIQRVAAFNQTVQWQHQHKVHPGYLHTLAFPLQIKLMLQQQFPFSIIGLVHLSNSIEQHEAVHIDDSLTITCHFGALKTLEIGQVFTLHTQYYRGQICVLSAQHQYLQRAKSENNRRHNIKQKNEGFITEQEVHWSLKNGLGRSYARCSGDYNPIHLWPLTAKLLGFKRHIIHGMWLKSRVLSVLINNQDTNFNWHFCCEVEFKKPLFLPNKVSFQQHIKEVRTNQENVGFRVISEINKLPVEHMKGSLTFN